MNDTISNPVSNFTEQSVKAIEAAYDVICSVPVTTTPMTTTPVTTTPVTTTPVTTTPVTTKPVATTPVTTKPLTTTPPIGPVATGSGEQDRINKSTYTLYRFLLKVKGLTATVGSWFAHISLTSSRWDSDLIPRFTKILKFSQNC